MTRLEAVNNILVLAQIENMAEVDMTLAIAMAYTLSKSEPEKEDRFFESLGVLIDHPHKTFASPTEIAQGTIAGSA